MRHEGTNMPNIMDDEKIEKMTEILPVKLCVNPSKQNESFTGTEEEVRTHKAECWKVRGLTSRGRGGARPHGQ